MRNTPKQLSNPTSTGGGGANFEARVQGAFVVTLLTGGTPPCLPDHRIRALKLQGRYAGFHTDDLVVFADHSRTGEEARLLAQIKRSVKVTAGDETFAEVIRSAWHDFNDEKVGFITGVDAIALITGPLSETDTRHVRPLLERARHSANEEEFLQKIETGNFSSSTTRDKLNVFKTHLKAANGGANVTPKRLWEFLKAFHLIGYDLDAESGSALSLLHALITRSSSEPAHLIWARVLEVVQTANQNAGTLTVETLPRALVETFSGADSSGWSRNVAKLKEHGSYILEGIRTTIGGVHVEQREALSRLLDLTEASGFVFVTGERGAGKSSLIREFSRHIDSEAPLFCLRAEELDKPHLDHVFSAIGLTGSLGELEKGFALMPKKYLVIESLEKVLELENSAAFRDLLQFVKGRRGWTVVATGRDYAFPLITTQYLEPAGVNFKTLTLEGFTDEQVRSLRQNLAPLQKLSSNPVLAPMLRSPFFAELAFRALEAGAEFTPQDGEEEFRKAVWREVIAKEGDRANGMPARRRRAFVDMAVVRAKRMAYGVLEDGFDVDAVFRLAEDDLVRRDQNSGLVSPAHDVLEDWALERFIDGAFRAHSSSMQGFLDAVGHEPAMNRAFRLWLHRKLRLRDDISDFVRAVLSDQTIARYWQDATIAAVLQGEDPGAFLELLDDQLLEDEGELLKRFCFILRVACQAPDQVLASELTVNRSGILSDALFLRPFGNGWSAIIRFLFQHRERLAKSLPPHLTAMLHDWASVLSLNKALPDSAREAGLLALHLLQDLKDVRRENADRKRLLSVIIRTASSNREEFLSLLNADVFVEKVERRRSRPRYTDELCKMAFFDVLETTFLAKHFPNTLIELTKFEWFYEHTEEDDEPRYASSRVNMGECFGLHEHKHKFFPASGAKGPFAPLLRHHPRVGLDFVLQLLNRSAEKYAHSTLDVPRSSSYPEIELAEPQLDQIDIHVNDGAVVGQYYSGRLWSAYRGHSPTPYLLQSALMALENWLIDYVKLLDSEDVAWVFDYVLKNSNSVMPTAVLASVATGFPDRVGEAALPLLRTLELYFMDSGRLVSEAGVQINEFAVSRDPYAGFYTEERREANNRPWRRESLETLVQRLQFFDKFRERVLAAIDILRATATDERARFLLHRIDSRGWEALSDKENNLVVLQPGHLEPELQEIQRRTQEEEQGTNRFLVLFFWANETFERKPPSRSYYASWTEALTEAKALEEELEAGRVNYLATMHRGGIVTAAVVLVRDHAAELSDTDFQWCAGVIRRAVAAGADAEDSLAATDVTGNGGAAAAASVLPVMLDFTSEDSKTEVKRLLVIALTHVNKDIRREAANGVRQHLWQRDAEFAHNCVVGAVEYARFMRERLSDSRKLFSLKGDAKESLAFEWLARIDGFRDRFARGELSTNLDISFHTHSPEHLLSPCLVIPDGSTEPEHVALLSRMLVLFFEAAQGEQEYQSGGIDNAEVNYDLSYEFARRFARYLLPIASTGFPHFVEQLKVGCQTAPDFIKNLDIHFAVEAEQKGAKETYWQFWSQLSGRLQETALELAHVPLESRRQDGRRKLIRSMLKVDVEWQPVDFENQDIALGKDLILDFAKNAGSNPDVFEALARFMHYFPSFFFQDGIPILAKHQKAEEGTHLLKGVNTSFYLERAIQRFLQVDHAGPLPRKMHESILTLLDAVVETASSRAYYLREHLIRSRRIA